MDIKTLYYLANFEHNFDDFKQRLDELFKVKGENIEYKLYTCEGRWQPQMNPPLPSEAYVFTPDIKSPLPQHDYWKDGRIDKIEIEDKDKGTLK